VNRSFADRYFPGLDPIGLRVAPSRAGGMMREVVGLVGDTRQSLDTPAEPEFYIPHSQDPWAFLKVAVRTSGNPYLILPQIQAAVWSVDRELPLSGVRTMDEMSAAEGASRRLVTWVLSVFAVVAYVLAAIGLYGVMAYTVAQRTGEIGVRMALGATQADIARMTLSRGVGISVIGTLAGLVAAVPLASWLKGLLFGVTHTDPVTFLGIGVLLVLVAIAASAIPTWRALKVDPALAMRSD
jgi:putative ABC transport system permease protein